MGAPQDWPRWAILLPHVLAATPTPPHGRPRPPRDAAWLLDRAGTYLQVHAQPSNARTLLERALAVTRPPRPRTPTSPPA